ncbi:MAG: type II toxin-antitoxin system VapC family toxin [Cocleimonas sp.]|nr:type II toxin-antitoxin system VapC family toxin [Cocleimonas sp.]
MGLIVDTNIFIDAENNRLDLGDVKSLQTQSVYIAAITVSELLAGVSLAKTADEKINRHAFVENILNSLPVLDFDTEVARTYAELYAYALSNGERNKKRQNINAHDLQIAATALVYGHRVLSSNTKDFKDIPGIQVISPYSDNMVHEDVARYSSP